MRPYKELCSVTSLTDLKLIKTLLNKNRIEYFVQGDPLDRLLLHLKHAMHIMVKYSELQEAKKLIHGSH